MKVCNKLTMRVRALLLFLPCPVLFAIPLPAPLNATREQDNETATITVQGLAKDLLTASITAGDSYSTAATKPVMIADIYSSTLEPTLGDEEMANVTEQKANSFERKMTDFNSHGTTSGNSYIKVSVTSSLVTEQYSDWHQTPSDLKPGETQRYGIEWVTTAITSATDLLPSNTQQYNSELHNRAVTDADLNNTTWYDDEITQLIPLHNVSEHNNTVMYKHASLNPHVANATDSYPTVHGHNGTDSYPNVHVHNVTDSYTNAYKGDVTDVYAEGPTENITNPFPTLHLENITDSQTNKSTTTRHESPPKCVEGPDAANPTGYHKLICFITLWALGVTAALFFGLTVFLWIRLSIQAKRRRRRTEGWGDEEMGGVELQEEKSLWLRPKGTVEERVEFWYANGSSGPEGGAGNQQRDSRRGNERRGEERAAEDLWVQPKVTLEEITEFWYAHGRPKQGDSGEQV